MNGTRQTLAEDRAETITALRGGLASLRATVNRQRGALEMIATCTECGGKLTCSDGCQSGRINTLAVDMMDTARRVLRPNNSITGG